MIPDQNFEVPRKTLTSEQIREQTERFLSQGGKVTELESGISRGDVDFSEYIKRLRAHEVAVRRGR